MKKIILLAAASLLPLSAFAAAEPRSIAVHGEGELKVKPDLAYITLQVQTRAKEAKTAQQKNAAEMARVQKVLKDDFHIEAKDIQTSGYNVSPNYRYDQNGHQTFTGYVVDHGLIVTLHKIEQAGQVLDEVVGRGTEEVGVQLSGIQFDTDKRKEYELQALEQAMKNAEARAGALARFAHLSLKGVHRISDSTVSVHPYMANYSGRAMMAARVAEAAAPQTEVSSGEIVVNSSVAVDWDME
jgi:uncharacterized protein